MSLIDCPECANAVSDKAPTCPKCGAPIATAQDLKTAGAQLTTVQETSKRLKLHVIGAAVAFWGGLAGAYVASQGPNPQGWAVLFSLAAFGGLVWYIVTRLRIWWHHK